LAGSACRLRTGVIPAGGRLLFGSRVPLDRASGCVDLRAQVGEIAGDDGEAQARVGLEGELAGAGEKLEAGISVEASRELARRRNNLGGGGAGNQEKFGRRRAEGLLARIAGVLFERDVKVAAAKTEG